MKKWMQISLALAVAVGIAACSAEPGGNHPNGRGSGQGPGINSPSQVPPASESEKGPAHSPGFLGFEGPDGYYLAEVTTDEGVTVLENSITVTQEGNWRVWGLVRNASLKSVGEVVVVATLHGKSGAVLNKASTTIPINPLRSGEPAPFELQSEVAASRVARVEWSTQTGQPNPNASRAIDVQVYWQVPHGVAEWKGFKRDDPPYPHLMQAGLENKGRPLSNANLAVAWLDKGRVVWVDTSTLDPERWRIPIPTDGVADFKEIRILDDQLKVYHQERAEYLYSLEYLLWAWGDTSGN